MNIIEQLTAHAQDLARTVGGETSAEAWAWVKVHPVGIVPTLEVHCKCCVGESGSELADGWGTTVETAFVKCVEAWKKLGSPTDRNDAKVKQLSKAAAKLGYTLVAVEAETDLERIQMTHAVPHQEA